MACCRRWIKSKSKRGGRDPENEKPGKLQYRLVAILGLNPKYSRTIPKLDSARRIVDERGIFSADVVLIPLEDGDRTIALKKIGKKVITFDLNPLSRTAQTADITIVDNVIRGMKILIDYSKKKIKKKNLSKSKFHNKKNLLQSISLVKKNLWRMSHA